MSAPRVLVVSSRDLLRQPSAASVYEFEDMVCAMGADRVDLTRRIGDRRFDLHRRADKLRQRLPVVGARTGTLPVRPDRTVDAEYDLAIVRFVGMWELYSLLYLGGWRERCAQVAVWIDEPWPDEFTAIDTLDEPLAGIDRFYSGIECGVDVVCRITGLPCHWIPDGADTDVLSPAQPDGPRPIGVFNIGRRSPVTHAALQAHAAATDELYYFDTSKVSVVPDHVAHRRLYGALMQRTDVAIANPAWFDDPVRGPYGELPLRYFEGLSAGCILLGAPPRADLLERAFGRPDVVHAAPADLPDVADRLAALRRDPDAVVAERARNMAIGRRRIDWAHRYARLLADAGLPNPPALDERLERLERIAARLDAG